MAGSHYDVLGVSAEASADDIRRAYHRLARQVHPDALPGSDGPALADAQRRMAALASAYAVLADPARRTHYDRSLGRATTTRVNQTAPPPRMGPDAWTPVDEDEDEDDYEYGRGSERFDRLGDADADGGPSGSRPEDFLMMVPPALAVLALAVFVVGVMVQSHTMWALAILLTPIAFVSFASAPLVSMLRARSRAEQDD